MSEKEAASASRPEVESRRGGGETPPVPPQESVAALMQALAAPFEATEVHFKPQTTSGNRALVVAFVDARAIQDRLDDVVGVENWEDRYHVLPDGAVVCRLRVRLGDEWIAKQDVGGPSEQEDEGDRRKAAFSDALKRAAVKFGIGRYLYRLKPQWVDFDPQKRQIVGTPRLPSGPAEAKPATRSATKPTEARPAARKMPADGKELYARLSEKDVQLAAAGTIRPGELIKAVSDAGVRNGLPKDIGKWSPADVRFAVDEVRAFEARKAKPTSIANRIVAADSEAVKERLCRSGELEAFIEGELAPKHGSDPELWPEADVERLIENWSSERRGRLPATAEQTKKIDAELARVGRRWLDCQKKLKLKKDVGLVDITRTQALEVLRYLHEMPTKAA